MFMSCCLVREAELILFRSSTGLGPYVLYCAVLSKKRETSSGIYLRTFI
jgi:hypothetical protein